MAFNLLLANAFNLIASKISVRLISGIQYPGGHNIMGFSCSDKLGISALKLKILLLYLDKENPLVTYSVSISMVKISIECDYETNEIGTSKLFMRSKICPAKNPLVQGSKVRKYPW